MRRAAFSQKEGGYGRLPTSRAHTRHTPARQHYVHVIYSRRACRIELRAVQPITCRRKKTRPKQVRSGVFLRTFWPILPALPKVLKRPKPNPKLDLRKHNTSYFTRLHMNALSTIINGREHPYTISGISRTACIYVKPSVQQWPFAFVIHIYMYVCNICRLYLK